MKIVLVIFSILTFSKVDAFVISCTFGMTDWSYVVDKVYSCNGNTFATGNQVNIEGVIGSHLGERTNDDVGGFYFTNQNISSIPKNLAEFFPNLKVMSFLNSQLLTVAATDLQPFPELLNFIVMSNNIVSIDGDLFMHNSKLLYIDFDVNQLQHVGHNLLANLNQLRTADFNRNPCVQKIASSISEIRDLNLLLPIICPSLTTTTKAATTTTNKPATTTTTESPEICSLRCTLNDEVSELQERLGEVEKKLREMVGGPNWRK